MKAIINNKLYDTKKAKFICEYLKNEPQKFFFNIIKISCWRVTQIYKTKKGQYFLYIQQGNYYKDFQSLDARIELIEEEEVKKIIKEVNPELYIDLFVTDVEEG